MGAQGGKRNREHADQQAEKTHDRKRGYRHEELTFAVKNYSYAAALSFRNQGHDIVWCHENNIPDAVFCAFTVLRFHGQP